MAEYSAARERHGRVMAEIRLLCSDTPGKPATQPLVARLVPGRAGVPANRDASGAGKCPEDDLANDIREFLGSATIQRSGATSII